MKKIFLCILILIICLFSGCTTTKIDGLQNFKEEDSSMSLTKNLIPGKEFLQNFQYVSGDYHYLEEKPFSEENLEIAIIILKYEQDEYKKAKEFCLKNLSLSDDNVREYNGFVFKENLSLPDAYDNIENGINKKFPYFFTMFSYNDNKCELVSIGFYCGKNLYNDASLANKDFSAFLQKFYYEFYNFG